MQVYTGASGYGYKEWKGPFYPEKIPAKEMLRFYSERLSAVEINNTFYHMPTERVLKEWAQQVPEHFLFTFKAPQIITHRKRLKNIEQETEFLFSQLAMLGPRLGPVLFQFPANFPARPDRLEEFLKLLPQHVQCAFAFRSATWMIPEIYDILTRHGRCLGLEDMDDSPIDEITATTSWGYLRLRRSEYSDEDLARWAEKVTSQRWERAYVFFKHEAEAKAPQLAMRFRELTGSAR